MFVILKWVGIISGFLVTFILGFLCVFYLKKQREFDENGMFVTQNGENIKSEVLVSEFKYILAGLAASILAIVLWAFFPY